MKPCLQETRREAAIAIGIDCAKDKHKAAISDNKGNQFGNVFVVRNTRADVDNLQAKVQTIIDEQQQEEKNVKVIVNLESTSVYHIPITSALSEIYQVNIFQPRQTKDETKKNIRRGKTDKKDAIALSKMHLTQTPPETNYSDKDMADIKRIGRMMFYLKDQRTNHKRQLRQLVHLSFPGFDLLYAKLSKKVPWELLKRVKTPLEALELGEAGIQQIIDEASRGQKCKVSGKDVIELATKTIHNTIMAQGAVFCIPTVMRLIEEYTTEYKRFEKKIVTYWSKIKDQWMISTVPFIKDLHAALLHVEFGGFDRFLNGDKTVAFSGLENYVYQSGASTNINGSMTKAGSPIIRRVLWEILSPPTRDISKITAHMKKLRKRGKHHHICVHSGAKKLLRMLNALERNKTPYEAPSQS
jgi:transposase